MIVLSLFDGMSGGQIALERVGIKVTKYFAAEIKKHAIKVTMNNYPNTIQIGDVTKIHYENRVLYTEKGNYKMDKIDLLIGGSPCQDFSLLKANGKGLRGEKSKLFYEYLRILKEVKPTYFLLENVRMKKESEQQLNKYLGTDGIHINSNLVSYQNRPRIYWTNIPNVKAPIDKHIDFQDYIGKFGEDLEQYKVKRTPSREKMWNDGQGRKNQLKSCDNKTFAKKINCISRKQDRSPNSGLIQYKDFCRYLTRRELEQGQTVPLGYTDCVSYNQAQDLLGDGWTIDVITHIFNNLKHKATKGEILTRVLTAMDNLKELRWDIKENDLKEIENILEKIKAETKKAS